MDASAVPDTLEKIGAIMRERREAKGWSQSDLAMRTKVPRETISRIENGRKPYVATLRLLCKTLKIKPSKVLHLDGDKSLLPFIAGQVLRDRRKKARNKMKQSLAFCAEKAGKSVSALSRLERELGRDPRGRINARLEDPDDPWLWNEGYAKALRFKSAANMREYLRGRLEKRRNRRITRERNREQEERQFEDTVIDRKIAEAKERNSTCSWEFETNDPHLSISLVRQVHT